jgi:hypothetical protein
VTPGRLAADVLVGARLAAALPGFLRAPFDLGEARAALRRRLDRRGADFLHLVRGAVYARPRSPYAALLRHAGCEYGDLARLVSADGVEVALSGLLAAGVYLTVDEFKGHRPAWRGGRAIAVDPGRLRNPLARCDLPIHSGGSRSGAGRLVGWSLEFVRERAVDLCVAAGAREVFARRHAVWGVPGSGALAHLLDTSAYGAPPVRWFSPVDPASPAVAARYRWSVRLVRSVGRLAGVRLPAPEHVPPDDPSRAVRWLQATLQDGATPHLFGYTSALTRVAEAARAAGIDLTGAELAMGGEPVTAARAGMVHASGARLLPRYAAVEAGLIGDACLAPAGSDDVHLCHDLVAVTQPGAAGARMACPPDALLVSSLRPTAPLVLLNVSMGDAAVLDRRGCGCPLERLGWTTHLHSIRSFEKLTGEGMTFLDADVIRILEEVLPARIGGRPGDYQLVEDEGPGGRARVRLLVHPDVGTVDPARVREAFLGAVGSASPLARLMEQVWRDAASVTVERRVPQRTASGKILHLHRAAPAVEAAPGSPADPAP